MNSSAIVAVDRRWFALILAPITFFAPAICNAQTAPQALELTGAFKGTHDPSIGEDHGKYYVFATGAAFPQADTGSGVPPPPAPGGELAKKRRTQDLPQFPIRCSTDRHAWTRCGEIFPSIPKWIQEMSPKTSELWAPDISYFDGLYHLYYAFSVFGKNTSGIALATNETLDSASPKYKWVDRGLVLRSLETDNFNAIDPNLILDAKGDAWLSFGSFWSGIKMRKLDRKTGLLSSTDASVYSLASRAGVDQNRSGRGDLPPDTEAVEAPFIFHHGDIYYLFVSWDLCCRGTKSTYRTMVGRSRNVTGPYLDREGHPMATGGGSAFLTANSKWLGPGGESLIHLPKQDLIVFHAYNATDGKPSLHISTLGWKDDWPEAALEGEK
ncbi:arabinan endo-1,5-alpha-L-arabinosidase [Granulicella aggregans]|uniref:Arabinan endo-1,5-alpha-L-arabinosidase n=1 Tax=Granulicella aggregans TaxID=474949 RepID=A0A7W8E602_9BACT|nr:arabinan endo-1,5-alpha-L-arabinosidase [Granulicella aggregans]MBB5059839.1 arabinan endo-1,5-alpha-L-arabinosidase [Granulicella aggregans]